MIRAAFVKTFPGFALRTDFTVPTSGTTVLWGESGSGKTTILNCIAGLVRPCRGEISIHDRLVFSSNRRIDEEPRSRGVGFVFQHYGLFPHLSALGNVALALGRGGRERALSWLERFGIAHLAKRRPASLSGGERQRLAFARALAVEPRVLLLDEPFSALDRATRATMHEEFKRLREELALCVVLVSHDRTEAESLGDRILEVRDGLALEGTG
jgi:molybdate transport system ATP-binding protein